MAADAFYIIWNPEGASPPRFRHEWFGSAANEAARLARENPGQEFIVMQAVRSVKVMDLTVTEFARSEHDDNIPF